MKNEQEPLDSRSFVQDFLEGANGLKGRPTKIQKPARPDSIWPEAWAKLSKKREEEIAEWPEVNAKLQAAHRNRGRFRPMTNITSR